MTALYRRSYRVQWADLDAIGHLRNSAYLDYAVDTRFSYLAEQGFTAADFTAAGLGPVVLLDEIRYRRELRFQEDFTVTFILAGLSADGSRMRLHNRFYRADGSLSAAVTSEGLWFDLRERRRIVPPEKLLAILHGMERTEDFAEIVGPPEIPEG